MIRGRGHRPYRPPQLLTGHIDDFPLVPETPITLPSRFEDRAPEATQTGLPVSTQDRAPEATRTGLPVSTQDRAPEATVSGAREICRAWEIKRAREICRAGEIERAREISRDPDRPSGTEGPILAAPTAPTTEEPAPPLSRFDQNRDPERPSGTEGRPILGVPTAQTAEEPALPSSRFDQNRDPERPSGTEGQVPAAFTPPPPGNKVAVEYLEAAKEMATISPSVANAMLQILESGERHPAAATTTIEVAARKSKSRLRKKSHPKKKKTPPPERLSRLELHQSHCKICGYEDQDEIDEAFVSWENVSRIAEDYDVDRRSIYRHASATGLYAKRDRNIRRALGRIIQKADSVPSTADSVVRAIKILTHVNARGEWVQPPTHVIFSATTAQPAAKRSVTPCKVKKGLNP